MERWRGVPDQEDVPGRDDPAPQPQRTQPGVHQGRDSLLRYMTSKTRSSSRKRLPPKVHTSITRSSPNKHSLVLAIVDIRKFYFYY